MTFLVQGLWKWVLFGQFNNFKILNIIRLTSAEGVGIIIGLGRVKHLKTIKLKGVYYGR